MIRPSNINPIYNNNNFIYKENNIYDTMINHNNIYKTKKKREDRMNEECFSPDEFVRKERLGRLGLVMNAR